MLAGGPVMSVTLSDTVARPVRETSYRVGANTGLSEAAKLAGFVLMAFGMFIALLDVQIVASSLAEIEAGLSANARFVIGTIMNMPAKPRTACGQ